jgi:inhibitor of KinA
VIPPIEPLGDSALLIRLGGQINEETHRKVAAVSARLSEKPFPAMIEYVPAFTTVAVHYDPARSTFAQASALVSALLGDVAPAPLPNADPIEIPVCYGRDLGPDLEFVAEHAKLPPDEVVRIHAGGDYRVYMIGFTPGFPFLGGLPDAIATPRRSSPRIAVPAGSVAIGGTQTGVYPIESPGGWQIIGRTRLSLFRPDLDPPTLLRTSQRVRFRPISRAEFDG